MSSLNCTSIEPNPDISGIGVRSAIYAQAVLTLIQPILASLDGKISEDELTGLHALYLGILLPGCALLFSAMIQERTFGLSVYHATIVLNLSWINNTSALIFFQFALIAQLQLDQEREFRRKVGVMWGLLYKPLTPVTRGAELDQNILGVALSRARGLRTALRTGLENGKGIESKEILEDVIQNLSALLGAGVDHSELRKIVDTTNERLQKPRLRKSLEIFDNGTRWKMAKAMEDWVKKIRGGETAVNLLDKDRTMAALASAHLALFSAFGVWLWATIHSFGNCESFTNITNIIIFVPIPVASQALRVVSIVIYIICLLPIINIVVVGGLELAIVIGCQQVIARIRHKPSSHNSPEPTSSLTSPGPEVLPLFIALTFLVQAYFIITTELTIRNNRHLLRQTSEENNWTFGQTLAIALTVVPLLQVWKEFRKLKVRKGLRESKFFRRLFGDPKY